MRCANCSQASHGSTALGAPSVATLAPQPSHKKQSECLKFDPFQPQQQPQHISFLAMNSSSTHQELTTPLIGTLPHEADIESQQAPADTRNERISVEETACDRFLTLLLPVLLLIQFGSDFIVSDVNNLGLEWKEVFCSIMIFAITTIIYQSTLRQEMISNEFFNVVPEITTSVVCGLIYFHMMSEGFLALVLATMLMALFIIISSIQMLLRTKDDAEEANEEQAISVFVI